MIDLFMLVSMLGLLAWLATSSSSPENNKNDKNNHGGRDRTDTISPKSLVKSKPGSRVVGHVVADTKAPTQLPVESARDTLDDSTTNPTTNTDLSDMLAAELHYQIGLLRDELADLRALVESTASMVRSATEYDESRWLTVGTRHYGWGHISELSMLGDRVPISEHVLFVQHIVLPESSSIPVVAKSGVGELLASTTPRHYSDRYTYLAVHSIFQQHQSRISWGVVLSPSHGFEYGEHGVNRVERAGKAYGVVWVFGRLTNNATSNTANHQANPNTSSSKNDELQDDNDDDSTVLYGSVMLADRDDSNCLSVFVRDTIERLRPTRVILGGSFAMSVDELAVKLPPADGWRFVAKPATTLIGTQLHAYDYFAMKNMRVRRTPTCIRTAGTAHTWLTDCRLEVSVADSKNKSAFSAAPLS